MVKSVTRPVAGAEAPATLNTAFLLASMYNGRPVISLDDVRRDWFSHLAPDLFARKVTSGEIPLPVFRIESSQKSPKGVHLTDLAMYLDERRKEALKVRNAMVG